jgi:cell filamentation protein
LTAQKHLRGLDARKFAEKAAHLLAEFNAIHPFREGTGGCSLPSSQSLPSAPHIR